MTWTIPLSVIGAWLALNVALFGALWAVRRPRGKQRARPRLHLVRS